jgi:hypothetical protein
VEGGWAWLIASTSTSRVGILQLLDALAEKLVGHRQLRDDGFHAPAILVGQILLTDLQTRLAAGQKGVAPGRQSGGRDGLLPAQALQILAAEEFQDNGHLAPGRPAALAVAAGAGGLSARPPGSLRGPRRRLLVRGLADSP